jgi:spermidine synthase
VASFTFFKHERLLIPRRKYFWSHFAPVILEETSSKHNPYLAVALAKGRLQLLSGNAIYSWDDLYDNFYHAFGKLHLRTRQINEALILGGGLGSIPFMLEKKFKQKNCAFTIIEYDEEVNYLSGKYSLCRLKSPVELITADAVKYMSQNVREFDLVCIDIFNDDLVPKAVESRVFLLQCAEALSQNGFLLFNRLYLEERDKTATDAFYQGTFQKLFPGAIELLSQGNKVLCWQKV